MPHASPELTRITDCQQRLLLALRAEDWDEIARIDQQIRELLVELNATPTTEPELQQARQQLRRVHAEALRRCARECERWRQLLQRHVEYAEGRAAYGQVDGLIGSAD